MQRASNEKKRIGALLVEAGMITEDQLKKALRLQADRGGKIVQNLVAMEVLDYDAFTRFLAKQRGLPGIEIQRYGVLDDIVSLIPKSFALQHDVFPLDRMGDHLTVGMLCPLDVATIQELEKLTCLHVMPLLCSAADLKASIQRYYGADIEAVHPGEPPGTDRASEEAISTSLKLAGIPGLVRQLVSLPALPITIHKIREAVDDPSISPKDVGSIISTDPLLAAKLLGIANSPAYGFAQQVTSIPLAVSLLGLRETYSVALSAAVVDLLKASRFFDYKTFWVKSMLCATLCKTVARTCGQDSKPGLFAAGLLLDIGRVALAEVAPQRYGAIPQDLRGKELILEEEHALGIAHPEAGYLLVNSWGLPTELAETIRFHHMPEYAIHSGTMAAVAAVADEMAYWEREERDTPEALKITCAEPLAALGLGEDAALLLLDETKRILKSEFLLKRKWESDSRVPGGA